MARKDNGSKDAVRVVHALWIPFSTWPVEAPHNEFMSLEALFSHEAFVQSNSEDLLAFYFSQ